MTLETRKVERLEETQPYLVALHGFTYLLLSAAHILSEE